jgi:hypothetical protein
MLLFYYLSTLHHELDTLQFGDVFQWIARYRDDVIPYFTM